MDGLTQSIPDDVQEMLFAYRYRTHFQLTEAEYEQESDDSKWLTRTIWAIEAERDNLRSRSGTT